MENENLASELIREIKQESKRRFILLIICLIIIFLSNAGWLIAWNLPTEDIIETESYKLDGEDSANVIYNSQGDVKINGKEERDNNSN